MENVNYGKGNSRHGKRLKPNVAKRKVSSQNVCAICGGELVGTTITYDERGCGELYFCKNVPAHICKVCGEIWIDDEVLEKVERLIKEGSPAEKIQTSVYDFLKL